jgi:hypothetical protein
MRGRSVQPTRHHGSGGLSGLLMVLVVALFLGLIFLAVDVVAYVLAWLLGLTGWKKTSPSPNTHPITKHEDDLLDLIRSHDGVEPDMVSQALRELQKRHAKR